MKTSKKPIFSLFVIIIVTTFDAKKNEERIIITCSNNNMNMVSVLPLDPREKKQKISHKTH